MVGRGVSTAPIPGQSLTTRRGEDTAPYLVIMLQETPRRFRFGREARIKQGRDFARVRQEGERLVIGCLIANWRKLPSGSASRLGVITAGKIGNAVVRSRARRLLRESFRRHQNELAQPLDLVLVARASIATKGFADVEKDFLTSLRKSGLLKETLKP